MEFVYEQNLNTLLGNCDEYSLTGNINQNYI